MAIELTWDHGKAWIEPLGAMLGPVEFALPGGAVASPLAVGPWGDDSGPDYDAMPGLMQRLRGEWPCVPFGAPDRPVDLPERWSVGAPVDGAGEDFHGFSSHNVWDIETVAPGHVRCSIDYPAGHAIARLVRDIRGVPGKPEIELTLTVEARADIRLPIALHPIFSLPGAAGGTRIDPGPFAKGWTFPGVVEPGVSRLLSDAEFDDLTAVPAAGGAIDLSALPLDFDTEELVQLSGVGGRVTLSNPDAGFAAWLEFDPEVFSGVVMWISNRGRRAYPWNGRFTAVGIEPVRAAFDLGPVVGCAPDNPMAAAGFPTAQTFDAAHTFSTTYRIGVTPT